MANDNKPPAAPAADAAAAKPAGKSKRYLAEADCYRHDLGRYIKRGEYVTLAADSKVKPSQTWTEVDENGVEVKGGQKALPIAKFTESKAKATQAAGGDMAQKLGAAIAAALKG